MNTQTTAAGWGLRSFRVCRSHRGASTIRLDNISAYRRGVCDRTRRTSSAPQHQNGRGYDFRPRMGEGKGANPKELLGARHSRNMRRTPRRTARSRGPCLESTFICEPSSCKFQRVDHRPYIFGWYESPMVNTE